MRATGRHPGTRRGRRGEAARLRTALAAAFLLSVASPDSLRAGGATTEVRLQSSAGHDSNVFEEIEAGRRAGDFFVRTQADARLAWRAPTGGWRSELVGRALTESYAEEPAEDRRQGEIHAALGLSGAGGARRIQIESGILGRDHRATPMRNHWRGWGRVSSAVPVGPQGSLSGRLDLWTLDFRRTARRDRTGGSFDLSYEHPTRWRFVISGGLELGTTRHGVASIQQERGKDPAEPAHLVEGPDRLDHVRLAHLGIRRVGRVLLRAQYAYRGQSSNSIDGEYRRHEFSWLAAGALPLGLHAQFYGNRGHAKFTHPALRDYFVPRVGEVEAGEDENTIALRITRGIGRGWAADLRAASYRNESLLVGEYYTKTVITAGLSWERGNPSGS